MGQFFLQCIKFTLASVIIFLLLCSLDQFFQLIIAFGGIIVTFILQKVEEFAIFLIG